MKNNVLIEHLASVDLSFLKVVKDEIVEVKNRNANRFSDSKKEHPEIYSKEVEDWSNNITEMGTY